MDLKTMVVMSRRERLREATYEEIKTIARQQMAIDGAAGISLRGIATQMGMAAPSLYNYYKSRDDLLTALIAENFTSLAEALENAANSKPRHDYAGRLHAAMMQYRQWAIEHPHDFDLIYGKPLTGYAAPEEITGPPVRRISVLFFEIMQEAWNTGKIKIPPEYTKLDPELVTQLEEWCKSSKYSDGRVSPEVLHLVLMIQSRGQGIIFLEINNHLHWALNNPAIFYRNELNALLKSIGLTPPTE